MGYTASRKLLMRVLFLESLLKFINFLEVEIRYTTNPLPKLFEKYEDKEFLSDSLRQCLKNMETGLSIDKAWQKAIDEVPSSYGLSKQDKRIIKDFGENLGVTDVDGQLSHCSLNAQLINTSLENAREEKLRKSKLYIMLGLFGGIALALILC